MTSFEQLSPLPWVSPHDHPCSAPPNSPIAQTPQSFIKQRESLFQWLDDFLSRRLPKRFRAVYLESTVDSFEKLSRALLAQAFEGLCEGRNEESFRVCLLLLEQAKLGDSVKLGCYMILSTSDNNYLLHAGRAVVVAHKMNKKQLDSSNDNGAEISAEQSADHQRLLRTASRLWFHAKRRQTSGRRPANAKLVRGHFGYLGTDKATNWTAVDDQSSDDSEVIYTPASSSSDDDDDEITHIPTSNPIRSGFRSSGRFAGPFGNPGPDAPPFWCGPASRHPFLDC